MQKIVCFSGQIANGKDESADYLADRLNEFLASECGAVSCCAMQDQERYDKEKWHRCAFGDAVKEVYMQAFGVDRAFIEKWKRLEECPPGCEKTVRESLMFIGDGFRQIDPNVWINMLFRNHTGNIILSDGRYISEVNAVKDRGGINVAIVRPGFENDIEHPSESQLKPEMDELVEVYPAGGAIEEKSSKFDYLIVNDGDLATLYEKAEQLISFVEGHYDD